jgi:hypothetical protein
MKQLTDHDLEIIFKLKRQDVIEINRSRLYREYKLSESFVEKHPNLIDWDLLSLCQDLSPEFIARNINRITSDILYNPCYENYPKLLLKTKFKDQIKEERRAPTLVRFVEDYPEFVVSLFWIITAGLASILRIILPSK